MGLICFWSLKGMAKKHFFTPVLWHYGTDFASIKRYDQFCFLLMYIRRHRFSLLSLFSISTLLSELSQNYLYLHLLSLSSFSLLSFSLSLCSLSLCSFPALSLSVCSLYHHSFLALSLLYIYLYSCEQGLTLKNVRSC